MYDLDAQQACRSDKGGAAGATRGDKEKGQSDFPPGKARASCAAPTLGLQSDSLSKGFCDGRTTLRWGNRLYASDWWEPVNGAAKLSLAQVAGGSQAARCARFLAGLPLEGNRDRETERDARSATHRRWIGACQGA